jgi:antitoxin component of RelBE/YafQ-DinJ toxin-antitoxin module
MVEKTVKDENAKSQTISQNTLPFDGKTQNRTTIETFEATDNTQNITKCESADGMFKKLKL